MKRFLRVTLGTEIGLGIAVVVSGRAMRGRIAIAAITLLLGLPPLEANAAATFQWSVPERLVGDGTTGAARSVGSAAKAPGTVIALRTCAADASWSLDGDRVRPAHSGRCEFRLELGDNDLHELKLEAGGDEVTQTVQARDLLIVSIGDSVASGEGNPDVPRAVHPRWLESRCHRSMRSGAGQAALAVAAGDPHTSVTFLPLACSGATVPTGLLRPYPGIRPDRRGDLPAQVAQLAELSPRRTIDAVLLSVGANDVYFGPLTGFCIWVDPCPQRRFDPDHPKREAPDRQTKTADGVHADAQQQLPRRYDRLAGELKKAEVPADRVIIVEYFDPTHDEHGETCRRLLPGIRPRETEWARQTVLGPLNREVRNAAQRHHWQLVGGVQQAFANHGVCARGQQKWVRRAEESLRRGSALSGPLHPNSAGHLATAALISPVLAHVLGIDPGAGVAQVAGAPDNEGDDVPWWWLLIAAGGGSLLTLAVVFAVRRGR